jgi:hypothetical protein
VDFNKLAKMGWQGTRTRQCDDFISLLSIHGNTMQRIRWGGTEGKDVVLL